MTTRPNAPRLTVGDVMAILKELENRYIQDQQASYESTSYYESCRNKEDAIADAISTIEYRMKHGA